MEFVEDHQPGPAQFGVVLQAAGQHPFGNHLHPGGRRNPAVEADPVADGLAHLLPQLSGHKGGRQPSRQSAGFEHQDLFPGQPGFIKQGDRGYRGFAGAGRSAEDYRPTDSQATFQLGNNLVDGEFKGHDLPGGAGGVRWRPQLYSR